MSVLPLRILVINPKTSHAKNIVRDVLYGCWCTGKRIGGASVPPFALLQIATVLRDDGNQVAFLDAQAEQKEIDAVLPLVESIDLVACSTSTMSFQEDADYLRRLKSHNPNLKTLIFGSHPTFMPQYALSHAGVDIIVRHEPEYIVRDLCRAMRSRGDWQGTRGIGFRDNNKQIQLTQEYPFIEDLDELPLPDVTLLPPGIDYFNPIVRRLPYMTVSTSRGCPGKCTFCTAPYFDGKKVRFQSLDYMKRLTRYLVHEGYREIYFRDDTFFVDKRRDHAYCRWLMDEKIDVTWLGNARVSMIDEETMTLARQAGCHTVKFGIESGSQEILDRIKKGYKVEEAHNVFDVANRIGLNTHAHVMIGNPGDTLETIKGTVEYVKQLNPTTATFGICTPYPGTPLFAEVAKAHPEIKDGTASDLSKLHTEGLYNELYCDVSKEDLGKMSPWAYRRFYLRFGYLLNFAFSQVRSIDDIKRVTLAGTRVLDFMFRGA